MAELQKTILLYPAGIPQKEAFLEAKSQNLYIVTVDGNPDAPLKDLADEFFPVNPADSDALLTFVKEYHAKRPIDGVLIVGCDLPIPFAKVCEYLGKPAISEKAARLTVDKIAMKQAMQKEGVAIPDFYSIDSAEQLEKRLRVAEGRMILKPNDNCGARGVLQVNSSDNAQSVYQQSALCSRGDERLILEQFIPGLQLSIEALVVDGKVYVSGIADRNYEFIDRYAPNIIENGATMPTSMNSDEVDAVVDMFSRGIHALGLNNCVAKGDMILSDHGPVVVEIAGRISGGKFASKLVPESNGINLLSAAIRFAMGQGVNENDFIPTQQHGVAVRYLFSTNGEIESITGLPEVESMPGIIESVVVTKVGDVVKGINSHADRSGWVVAVQETREQAIALAEKAINTIELQISSTSKDMTAEGC